MKWNVIIVGMRITDEGAHSVVHDRSGECFSDIPHCRLLKKNLPIKTVFMNEYRKMQKLDFIRISLDQFGVDMPYRLHEYTPLILKLAAFLSIY